MEISTHGQLDVKNSKVVPGQRGYRVGTRLSNQEIEGKSMEEMNNEQGSTTSTIKKTIAGISGCLTTLIFTVGGLILLITVFKGTPWIAENIYPWAMLATAITIVVAVPISLLLAIFKRTRGAGGVGLFVSSYIVGISLWIWSLIVAYSLAGFFWTIAGLLIGGVGIVPIALIASLLKAEWAIAVQILVIAIVVFSFRWFGIFLAETK